MYAVVEIAGEQLKVAPAEKVVVPKLPAEAGQKVTFDRVLLLGGEGTLKIGAPVVEGATVIATVLSHSKGDKILVFKKKRRKGYRVLRGHRQQYSQIQIDTVGM
jgi:large subunit ribosomal protein L21